MSTTKTFLGFMVGAAAGAIAGILLAPDKGSETRKMLSQKATDLGNTVKDTVNEYADSTKQVLTGGKDKAAAKTDAKSGDSYNSWS